MSAEIIGRAEPEPAAGSETAFRPAPVSRAYGSYALWLLMLIYLVNQLDRQVVNILAEPIKRDLRLADWQLGLLTGLAFSVLYTLLGAPVARAAERGNRPMIIAVAAAVWSAFTICCGFAQNFPQLVLTRIGVGVGEAGCVPPAHSLVVDYAAPGKRSSALAVFGLGAPLGVLVGMAFGGLVADAYGWRAAFIVAGAPGLLLAVMVAASLREPRLMPAWRAGRPLGSASFGETLRLLSSKPTFWLLTFGTALKALIAYGQGPFVASFFLRIHRSELGVAARELGHRLGVSLGPTGLLGLSLGLLGGLCGVAGMWCGGRLADRLGARDVRNWLRIPALGALLTVPAFVGVVTTPSLGWAFALYGVHAFAGAFSYGPTYSVAFSVAPPHMRATTSALLLFASNLIGFGLGPLAVGVGSDLFALSLGEAEGLRRALFVTAFVGGAPFALFWIGARTLRSDLAGEVVSAPAAA
jgi:MFS family permease